MNYFKLKKTINWRKENGKFIFLSPTTKKLLFYNEKISKTVDEKGYIIETEENKLFISQMLKEQAVVKIREKPQFPVKQKGVGAPFNVTIQITNKCNLRCGHCHRLYKKIDTMSLGSFKNLARDLRSINVFNINFSGGEPSLIEDFPKMVEYANKLGIKTTASTNNTLMNSSLAKTLKSSGLDAVHISLDSSIPDKHDEIRGYRGAFDKMTRNLKYLKKNNIDYLFVTTLVDQTSKDYANVIDLAYKLGAYGHKTNTIVPEGRAKEKLINYYKNPGILENYIKIWRKKKNQYQGKIKILAETMFELQMDKKSQNTCPAGILTCAINENGDVIPCSFYSSSVVGNVFTEKFAEIWQKSKKLEQIRSLKCLGCKAMAFSEDKLSNASHKKGNHE